MDKWLNIYMNMTLELAKGSYDPKYQVGCLIVSEDLKTIYSNGVNGNVSGMSNERDSMEDGASGFLHAEQNATIRCIIPTYIPKIAFVSHTPCNLCTKHLIMLGVKKIYYHFDYKSNAEQIIPILKI